MWKLHKTKGTFRKYLQKFLKTIALILQTKDKGLYKPEIFLGQEQIDC